MTCARDIGKSDKYLNIASDNKRSDCRTAIESAPIPRKLQAPAADAVSNTTQIIKDSLIRKTVCESEAYSKCFYAKSTPNTEDLL